MSQLASTRSEPPTGCTRLWCVLLLILLANGSALAQSRTLRTPEDSARVAVIIADFQADAVRRSTSCQGNTGCRHAIDFRGEARALEASVRPRESVKQRSMPRDDGSRSFVGLRVKRVLTRGDTVVVSVDRVFQAANSAAWSEEDTELLLVRDRIGQLSLRKARLLHISDFRLPK